jgi:HD-GYP domain-containing protein (c-di-GMP phosphodiesterase class II)
MTSKDRPYKPAVPIEDTLKILLDEVRHGNLDPALTECFISQKAYQNVFDASFPGGSPLKDA